MQITRKTWHQLSRYLAINGVPSSVITIQIEHSPEEDRRNAKDPRGFCHVDDHDWTIHCALALESVIAIVRVGLLLHEAAHLIAEGGLVGGDVAEINADTFILQKLPEVGYSYLPEYQYVYNGVTRTAKNIQVVSPEFVRVLGLVRP